MKRFGMMILVALVGMAIGGCEAITAVDRRLIPDGGDAIATSSGVGGSGGAATTVGSGGTGGALSDAGPDSPVDAPTDSGPDATPDADAGPSGPCDNVPSGIVAVIMTAPVSHGPGLVGIGAWIQAPDSEAALVSWSDPFPGCVVSAGQETVTCLFGALPTGAKVKFIGAMHVTATSPAINESWFSYFSGTLVVTGDYLACVGSQVVGAWPDGGVANGALSLTDENNSPNIMVTVP